ncbi:anaerobic coproporphyrinogen III oxidase [Rhodothalassium salexigens DSM 2132]|uniref:Coproporphyrinogen-III oxidase n=1 Tax=Rhodothalassium salexigens DSM 2132 TaxID=1188247 RepID=A0A4R2PH69_RHOSA|nr:oxygen-independent coproporphyrinogen III oxidase [Rhodothalassium salexigens]MBB4211814.1 oxygen-independent coproporphyrinogen-3 oxidase [Rhodothalassium salexigens DSM 2132]MBK1638149.1 oxygen-independent coproporphyrinogen III oxidase [Rhodothalassium salexigens DSM 2132]TCP33888.1 anaerobic coproporphyrinogen III oxidase [Rhodothalassium salexigens DSM 2132]
MTIAIPEKYATQAVPRYTSYPTAPHFHDGIDEATYRGWLAELDPAKPISLYLHVPFCKQMCWYCGCNMKLSAQYQPIADYVALLKREIHLLADALPGRLSISHIHWGGGTPNTLSPEDFRAIVDTVKERFTILDDAEHAVECDPRSLTDALIATMGELGITRASFGVQEFDAKVQAAINRIQPFEMVEHAVKGLRSVGVERINFDLIYGLPYQTVETLRRSIELTKELAPDRIALFGYAHVPWRAKNQRMIPDTSLPAPEERAAQAEMAEAALTAAGYRAIGLDHFALPHDSLALAAEAGTLHRNFQGYTDDDAETLLSVGTTGIGYTPSGYIQNIPDTRAWSRAVEAGHLPVEKGVAISEEDALRGRVITRLMCDNTVDTAAIGAEFGRPADWCGPELAKMDAFAEDGLLVREGSRITLTPLGERLVRIVAASFDTYLQTQAAKHSAAV